MFFFQVGDLFEQEFLHETRPCVCDGSFLKFDGFEHEAASEVRHLKNKRLFPPGAFRRIQINGGHRNVADDDVRMRQPSRHQEAMTGWRHEAPIVGFHNDHAGEDADKLDTGVKMSGNDVRRRIMIPSENQTLVAKGFVAIIKRFKCRIRHRNRGLMIHHDVL
ncbi:hypothetical protein SAMCCGM7_pB0412 (plasmid) [Sinorhizobium americanum CCGM7]|nr:hypothetical protein SAMCCGM7_pB0412 [Sinorhizobium americanum CCGM7]